MLMFLLLLGILGFAGFIAGVILKILIPCIKPIGIIFGVAVIGIFILGLVSLISMIL